MANDLATLSSKLATQLRDTGHDVWNSTEKDDLITWSVANLYPRFARYIDPSVVGAEITLVDGTYFYSVPSGVLEVSGLDWIDTDGDELGTLDGQAWQVTGDPFGGTLKIRVAPRIVEQGGTLRVHGYGRYDTTTNLIPDDYVPLVLAQARSEAYLRMVGDRARFEQWLAREQTQNVSVNELEQMVNQAEGEALRLRATLPKTFRRPVPGRLGS